MNLYAVTLVFYSGKRITVQQAAANPGAASIEAVMRNGAIYSCGARFCGNLS